MSSHPTSNARSHRGAGHAAVIAATVAGVAIAAPAAGIAVAATQPNTVVTTGPTATVPACQAPAGTVMDTTSTTHPMIVGLPSVPDTPRPLVPGDALPDDTTASGGVARRDSGIFARTVRLATTTFARDSVPAVPGALRAVTTTFARDFVMTAPRVGHVVTTTFARSATAAMTTVSHAMRNGVATFR